jgi:hypothetical protein
VEFPLEARNTDDAGHHQISKESPTHRYRRDTRRLALCAMIAQHWILITPFELPCQAIISEMCQHFAWVAFSLLISGLAVADAAGGD